MSFCVFAPPRHLFISNPQHAYDIVWWVCTYFFLSDGDPVFIMAKIILILDHFCQTAFSFNLIYFCSPWCSLFLLTEFCKSCIMLATTYLLYCACFQA